MKLLLVIILSGLLVGCSAPVEKENPSTPIIQNEETSTDEDINTDTNEEASTEKDLDMNNVADGSPIVVKDENFVKDMDEIFINIDEYVGKTIQYEGFLSKVEESGFAVTRFYDMGHEDHIHEILVGLECFYEGTWPKEDTWVEVSGIIEKKQRGEEIYPVVRVEKVVEKETRGQEKVYN